MRYSTRELHIPRRSNITAAEKGFIFANHETMSIREMAARLKRSTTLVRDFMIKYGLETDKAKILK